MPDDPGVALDTAIQSAVSRFKAGRGIESFESHNDKRVTGWRLNSLPTTESRDGPYLTKEYAWIVISIEGEIWEYSETTTELQESPWTFTTKNFLFLQSRQMLVGGKGKPFAEIVSTLDRAGW